MTSIQTVMKMTCATDKNYYILFFWAVNFLGVSLGWFLPVYQQSQTQVSEKAHYPKAKFRVFFPHKLTGEGPKYSFFPEW